MKNHLDDLYQVRFEDRDLPRRVGVWRVLCRFFQRYIPQDAHVLDLGAGYCEFINGIQAAKKTAVDLNPATRDFAAPEVAVLQCPAEDLTGISDASVDVVFASNFFEHLPSTEALLNCLSEIKRVLRPGGRFIVLQPNIRYAPGAFWDFLDHHLPLSDKSMAEALGIVGFSITEVRPRFLPLTTKRRLPQWPWLVSLYLRLRAAQLLMGKQMLIVATKALESSKASGSAARRKAPEVTPPPAPAKRGRPPAAKSAAGSRDRNRARPTAPKESGDTRRDWSFFLGLVGLLILIFGSRLWLVQARGCSLPFWDEWNGYVGNIVIPWSHGQVHLSDLLQPHNEHRIFFSHLLALSLLALNNQADPVLAMIFSAFLHTLTALGLILLLVRTGSSLPRSAVLLGVFVLWVVPINWHNILWGFQSAFYFVIFFFVAAIWGLLFYDPRNLRWWIGALSAVAACISLASGFLAAGVVVVIKAYLTLVDREKRRSHLSSLLFCLAVVVAAFLLRSTPESSEQFRAAGLHAFFVSLGLTLAWPYQEKPWLALLYLPFVLVAIRTVWVRHRPLQDEIVLLAIGGWALLTSAGIAYARGQDGSGPAVRYDDFLTIGLLCNMLSFWVVARPWVGLPRVIRRALPVATCAWVLLASYGLVSLVRTSTLPEIQTKWSQSFTQLANSRHYVLTGDQDVIQNQPYLSAPFPYADALAEFLMSPSFREYQPAELMTPPLLPAEAGYDSTFEKNGVPASPGKYEEENVLGSFGSGGRGASSTGTYVSQPFLILQNYVEVPVTGSPGDRGMSLYFLEEKLATSDFHTYAFDVPAAQISALRFDPASKPCDIVVRSAVLHVEGRSVPLPLLPRHGNPSANQDLLAVGDRGYGALYRAVATDPQLVWTDLRRLGLDASQRVRLEVTMWVSEGSIARCYWDAGTGFQEANSATEVTVGDRTARGMVPPVGARIPVTPPWKPGGSWLLCYARAPRYPVRLVAVDERADEWFAFAMPRGMGALSYRSKVLLMYGPGITLFGAVLFALAGALSVWGGFRRVTGHNDL